MLRILALIGVLFVSASFTGCGGGGGDNGTPANRAPIARDVSASTNEDVSISGQLSATDADGDAISFQLVSSSSAPHKGTLTITDTNTGAFSYVPDSGAFGVDEFTYRANDGKSNSNDAKLTVRINARPRIEDISLATVANELAVATLIVSDPDSADLTISLDSVPTNGTVTILDSATRSLEYQPNSGFVGADQFSIIADDGSALSQPGNVLVDVRPRPVLAFTTNSSIGNESQTEQISVTVDPPSPLESTVSLVVAGTATADLDFETPATPLVIPAGATEINIALNVTSDDQTELGETVDLTLSAPCGACDIDPAMSAHEVTLDDWRGSRQLASDGRDGFVVTSAADDADSGLIIGAYGSGNYEGIALEFLNGFVAKYDSVGELSWLTPLLPLFPAEYFAARVTSIVKLPNGDIVAAGEASPDAGSRNVFISKLGPDGTSIWSTIFGNSAEEDIASRMAVDSSGNIYVSGRTSNDLGGPSAGSCDMFVAKFDQTGAFQWVRQVGSPICDVGVALAVTNTDRVIAAGNMFGAVGGVPIQGASAVIILVFDTNGNEINRTFLDSPQDERVDEAVALTMGGALIVGGADELEPGSPRGLYTAKVSDSGAIEWTSVIPEPEGGVVRAMAMTKNDSVIMTGNSSGFGAADLDPADIFVLSVDNAGDLLWVQRFGAFSRSDADIGEGVGVDNIGNAYVVGYSNSDLLGFTKPIGRHSVIVKLDEQGVIH